MPKRPKELIAQKVISSGMIPKVNCCLDALEEGVTKTHIIDGTAGTCHPSGNFYGRGDWNADPGET